MTAMRTVVTAVSLSLVLVGCSSGPEAEPEVTLPTVSGAEATGSFGTAPEVTTEGAPDEELALTVLETGDGDTVEDGDLLLVDYLGQVQGGGVFDSSFERGEPSAFPIGTGQVIAGWDQALVGLTTGSRVILSVPPELGYGSDGQPEAGIAGDSTLVFVVDVLAAYGSAVSADPDADPVPDPSVPDGVSISGDLGAEATVTVSPDAPLPALDQVEVLARSDGDPVVPGQVLVQYTVSTFSGSDTYSTWEEGTPQVLSVGDGSTGSAIDQLAGVPLGSRVLLTLAPDPAAPAVALPEDTATAVLVDVVAQASTSEQSPAS